jgi:hypothetical protein
MFSIIRTGSNMHLFPVTLGFIRQYHFQISNLPAFRRKLAGNVFEEDWEEPVAMAQLLGPLRFRRCCSSWFHRRVNL